jgi:DNA-binding transcriptional regulator YiaG
MQKEPEISDLPPIICGDELRNWIRAKGISQAEAARLCSVSEKTFRRWIAGRPKMPKGIWELLYGKVNESQKIK